MESQRGNARARRASSPRANASGRSACATPDTTGETCDLDLAAGGGSLARPPLGCVRVSPAACIALPGSVVVLSRSSGPRFALVPHSGARRPYCVITGELSRQRRRYLEVRRISAARANPDATPGPLTREGISQECPRSAQMIAAVADAAVTASRIARQARAKRRSVSSKARRSSSSSRRLLLAVRAIARSPRSGVREHTVDDVGDLGGHHVAGFLATAVPLGNPGLLVTVAVL
jgi:hypothetical protein